MLHRAAQNKANIYKVSQTGFHFCAQSLQRIKAGKRNLTQTYRMLPERGREEQKARSEEEQEESYL